MRGDLQELCHGQPAASFAIQHLRPWLAGAQRQSFGWLGRCGEAPSGSTCCWLETEVVDLYLLLNVICWLLGKALVCKGYYFYCFWFLWADVFASAATYAEVSVESRVVEEGFARYRHHSDGFGRAVLVACSAVSSGLEDYAFSCHIDGFSYGSALLLL